MALIVIWSGGFDSTFLLLESAKFGSAHYPTYALSVVNPSISAEKVKRERAAREKIKAKLIESHAAVEFLEVEFTMQQQHIANFDGFKDRLGIPQLNLWLGSVLHLIPHDSRVQFGYVVGDCFWAYRHEFDAIVRAMSKIDGIRGMTLEYPLEATRKSDVVRKLKEVGYYDLCWCCEIPMPDKPEPCGKCEPCVTHALALRRMEIEDSWKAEVQEADGGGG